MVKIRESTEAERPKMYKFRKKGKTIPMDCGSNEII
jgi:hypothetical protein